MLTKIESFGKKNGCFKLKIECEFPQDYVVFNVSLMQENLGTCGKLNQALNSGQ